jgi:mono/diheme cytochrome c family protein
MAVLLAIGCTTVIAVYALVGRPAPGLPPAKLDSIYVQECGACHFAFPPSLAPSTTWAGIMDRLDHHFGEDASLEPATLTRLRAYLMENAAEYFDTLAANRLRITDPTEPLRITATPFWRRAHSAIPDRVFADKQVGGRTSCGACHGDAKTGLFAPQSIELPEEIE